MFDYYDERRVYASIIVESSAADRYAETNGIGESAPVPFLEKVMQQLDGTGITLECATLADDDEDDVWYAYRNYVLDWAMNASPDDSDPPPQPLGFIQWRTKTLAERLEQSLGFAQWRTREMR